MRAVLMLSLALCCAACASTSSRGRGDTAFIRTADVQRAAVQPLQDLNLTSVDIPVVLRRAAAAPYAEPRMPVCATLQEEIRELDAVLGPDADVPRPRKSRFSSKLIADAAVDAVEDAATGWIPMRSIVRHITGAEQQSREAAEAVVAGAIRRGYLKGIGRELGCSFQTRR